MFFLDAMAISFIASESFMVSRLLGRFLGAQRPAASPLPLVWTPEFCCCTFSFRDWHAAFVKNELEDLSCLMESLEKSVGSLP